MIGPITQFVIIVAATLAGLILLVTLFVSSQPANPVEAFLAALLFVGGAVALWTKAKPAKSKKAATSPVFNRSEAIDSPKKSEPDELLAPFLKKPSEEPLNAAESPRKSEADEFLAQFLKK